MVEWEYKGEFLEQFESNRRSYIVNIFCYAYRGGDWINQHKDGPAKDLTEMLKRVAAYCEERIAMRHHQTGVPLLEYILSILQEDETKAFCRFIAKREKLTKEEKEKAKGANQQQYVNKAMQSKPPTDKQLWRLGQLGSKLKPANMHEASVEIDRLMKAKV
jgi:aspartate aminotransferase-like enzyme